MKMKSKVLAMLFAAVVMFSTSSCKKDDDTSKPVIGAMEIGANNSHSVVAGTGLHVEGEISADAKIDKVIVEIHQEEGDPNELEFEFDDYAGMRNATFHKHIQIPADYAPGDYHFHFIVVDMDGNSTTLEVELAITASVDTESPVLNITDAPAAGFVVNQGEAISLSGVVTDNVALEGLLVALVNEEDGLTDEEVDDESSKTIVMLHTHSFADMTSHSFTATIVAGAAMDNNVPAAAIGGDNAWRSGNYFILVKSVDAAGNWVISQRYPITINL